MICRRSRNNNNNNPDHPHLFPFSSCFFIFSFYVERESKVRPFDNVKMVVVEEKLTFPSKFFAINLFDVKTLKTIISVCRGMRLGKNKNIKSEEKGEGGGLLLEEDPKSKTYTQ